jgi:hypothetical protein
MYSMQLPRILLLAIYPKRFLFPSMSERATYRLLGVVAGIVYTLHCMACVWVWAGSDRSDSHRSVLHRSCTLSTRTSARPPPPVCVPRTIAACSCTACAALGCVCSSRVHSLLWQATRRWRRLAASMLPRGRAAVDQLCRPHAHLERREQVSAQQRPAYRPGWPWLLWVRGLCGRSAAVPPLEAWKRRLRSWQRIAIRDVEYTRDTAVLLKVPRCVLLRHAVLDVWLRRHRAPLPPRCLYTVGFSFALGLHTVRPIGPSNRSIGSAVGGRTEPLAARPNRKGRRDRWAARVPENP